MKKNVNFFFFIYNLMLLLQEFKIRKEIKKINKKEEIKKSVEIN